MTEEQLALLLQIIDWKIAIATHKQTPPKDWNEELARLEDELRETVE